MKPVANQTSQQEIDAFVDMACRASRAMSAFGQAACLAADLLKQNPSRDGVTTFLKSLDMLGEELSKDMDGFERSAARMKGDAP